MPTKPTAEKTLPETIKLIEIDEVKLWQKNPHQGDIDWLKRVFSRYGFNGLLSIWRDSTVMRGNHSTQALQQLKRDVENNVDGAKTPRGVAVTEAGKWFVPYVDITYMSEQEATAYAISDNRISALGIDDPRMIAQLLAELEPELQSSAGYDSSDLVELLALLDEPSSDPTRPQQEPGDAETTDVPELYSIIVDCESEAIQVALLGRLMGDGYTCRAQVL
jgi:hypothetical protein